MRNPVKFIIYALLVLFVKVDCQLVDVNIDLLPSFGDLISVFFFRPVSTAFTAVFCDNPFMGLFCQPDPDDEDPDDPSSDQEDNDEDGDNIFPVPPATENTPTESPTKSPTESPTESPNKSPTKSPSESPIVSPTKAPTESPTKAPNKSPTESPTKSPSKSPTVSPTKSPTKSPSESPSKTPTLNPTPSSPDEEIDPPPFEIDEVWVQAQSIDGSDIIGTVVALNNDGNRLVMGGFATLFVYDGSTNNDGTVEWSLSADLSDSFSSWISAVDITSDGEHIVVSETTEDVTSPDFGAAAEYTVRAFKYVGSWVQDGPSLVSETPGDGFGASVAISEDGSKIVVGAPYGNYVDVIFLVIGQEWTLRLDGVEDNSFFGSTVSLAADGRFLAVGAPHGKDYQGCAYIIDVNQRLVMHSFFGTIQGENTGDYFGSTLAFSKDQSVLAIGSTGKSDASTYASVFLLNSDTDEYDPISSIQGTGERSRGWSLDLSSDGGRITIGMPYNDEEGTNSGKTSIYAIGNASVLNVATFLGAPEDQMGSTVSISGDGTVIVSGAIGNEDISARLMRAIPE